MVVRIIEIVPYDEAWPSLFMAEAQRLGQILRDVVAIHHIGSTSVPGLAAKPIIDILLEVNTIGALDAQTQTLSALGYEAKGEFGIAGRRYFAKGGMQRTHQVHAFARGDPNVTRHLAFRDYLRAHPGVASEYADLKRRVAASCQNDIVAYSAGKRAFIQTHEAAALKWRSSAA